jgi:hypothetical protein
VINKVVFYQNWRLEDRSDYLTNYPQLVYTENLLGNMVIEEIFVTLITIRNAVIGDTAVSICSEIFSANQAECEDMEEYSVTNMMEFGTYSFIINISMSDITL